jgi:hypothetical protein
MIPNVRRLHTIKDYEYMEKVISWINFVSLQQICERK